MPWVLIVTAHAAGGVSPDTIGLSVRLIGESLTDAEIGAAYDEQGLGGELAVRMPMWKFVHASVELGYLRRGGVYLSEEGTPADASWFWYAPLSFPVSAVLDLDRVRLGAGLGPSYTLFAEADIDRDGRESGGKFGFVVAGTASLRTRLVQRPLHSPDSGPARLDATLTVGYRHAFREVFGGGGAGHDLSAARAALGAELIY